jgi:pyruvate dehydrogenase E2 component (dihydrolipoamide acetyltransferase)
MSGRIELRIPDIGDFSDVEIIEVHVSSGDAISVEDTLITLETDKAAMDVPATSAGRIVTVAVKSGDRVSEGDLIVEIEAEDSVATEAADQDAVPEQVDRHDAVPGEAAATTTQSSSQEPAVELETVAAPRAIEGVLPAIDEAGFAKAHASPSVRKFARELGVDLSKVSGSGSKGRVTRDDIKGFVKSVMSGTPASTGQALPAVPEVDFEKFGDVEVQPLSRIQKISGPRLHASWVNLPHVTQFDSADITELEARRQVLKPKAAEQNAKLTPLAFIIVAVVRALQEFPVFNASLDPSGKDLVLKKYFHVGFAADTPNGLMVPVIKNADKRSLLGIARELSLLSGKARDGKLAATDFQGGCFTVSSLGSIGGTAFTPIINAPELAILGVSRASIQPVYVDGEFQPRLMLPLSLSYDHRVIDGAVAVRFTRFLAERLADPDGLILS